MARYKKYTIAYGDTIQAIAQNEMGTMTRWQEIIEYNTLSYPFIVDTLDEKLAHPGDVVTIGDTIIIPIEIDLMDTDAESLGNRDRELIMGLALGRDLAVSYQEETAGAQALYGESMGLGIDRQGEIKTVSGVDNLKQAVINRLLTPRGSLLMHPSYGSNLYNLLGQATNTETLVMIEDEIVSTIKKDGRVDEVEVVNSTIDGEVYSGEFIIQLFSFQEYFEVVIEGSSSGEFVIR